MTDLTFAAAVDIAAAIKSKRISSREITQHYIERIEALDESVNAVCVRVFEDLFINLCVRSVYRHR